MLEFKFCKYIGGKIKISQRLVKELATPTYRKNKFLILRKRLTSQWLTEAMEVKFGDNNIPGIIS